MQVAHGLTTSLCQSKRLHFTCHDEGAPCDKISLSYNTTDAAFSCGLLCLATPKPLIERARLTGNGDRGVSISQHQNNTKGPTYHQEYMQVPSVSVPSTSTMSDITTTAFTTRHHTVTTSKPTSAVHNPTTSVSRPPQIPGTLYVPSTTESPSRATIFWAMYMALLIIVLIGYVCFTIHIFAREIPKGRQQRRQKAERAARAAKEAVALGQGAESNTLAASKPAPRLIDKSSRRRRLSPNRNWKANGSKLNGAELGESYEMDDLGVRRRKDSAAQYIRWVGDVAGALPNNLRQPRGNDLNEAQIWSGLTAQNIDDVDDSARIAALKQMREMQAPTQTNLGDNNEWSPVLTTENLRERLRSRRRYAES